MIKRSVLCISALVAISVTAVAALQDVTSYSVDEVNGFFLTSVTAGGTTFDELVAPTSVTYNGAIDFMWRESDLAVATPEPTNIDEVLGVLSFTAGSLNAQYTVQFSGVDLDASLLLIMNHQYFGTADDNVDVYAVDAQGNRLNGGVGVTLNTSANDVALTGHLTWNRTGTAETWDRYTFGTVFSLADLGLNGLGATGIEIVPTNGKYDTLVIAAIKIPPVAVTGISLDVNSVEMREGESTKVTASVMPANAANRQVIWTSGDEGIATVDQTGLITGQEAGTTTITATSDDGGFTAQVNVTILPPGEPVTGIEIRTEQIYLEVGELGVPLYLDFEPAHAGNTMASWESADPGVATVSADGFVIPVSEGSTIITATSLDGGYTDTVQVEVGSGWTELTPHPSATIYYISSSEGSDDNDGLSPESPLATANAAFLLIKKGDWVLLKRGDTFHEELSYWENGYSEEYRSVIGAYGDPADPRPLIIPPGDYGMQLHAGSLGSPKHRPATMEHVAFVSLHLYNSRHDPGSPDFNPSSRGGWGVSILRPGNDVLFEDILSEYFGQWRFQADSVAPMQNITVRRSTIRNNWGGRAQGIFQAWCEQLTFEECVFDHNGWNEEAGTLPTIFNHNLYLSSEGADVVVRRNIIARASSHGMQLRSEGIAEQNVFINNSIGGFVSNNSITEDFGIQILNDNVVLEGSDKVLYNESDPPASQGTRSWGIGLNYTADKSIYWGDPLEMQGNIVANGPATSRIDYDIVSGLSGAPYKDEGNITYNWGTSANTVPNTPYSDPGRTTGSYNESLGGEASIDAFLVKAGDQRLGDWDPNYSWMGIWSYIREGFDKEEIYWRPVSAVEIADDSLSAPVGQSITVDAAIVPYYASNTRVMWSSSNESIATVNKYGRVSLLAEGTATITATSVDGGLTDSVEVTVAPPPDSFSAIIGATVVSEETSLYDSAWLGAFFETGGWIYQQGMEFLFAGLVNDSENIWLWSVELETWIYTNADLFPWIWVEKNDASSILWVKTYDSDWLYFGQSGTAGYLYSFQAGSWISVIPPRRGR